MFSNLNKQAFGTGTSTPSFAFGTTSTANQTPFGQSQLFGKSTTTTTGFGNTAPFGSTTQPQQPPAGTLFSSSTVPSFTAAPQTGFGTGLFTPQQNPPGNVFSATTGTSFGQPNKIAGFGFTAPTATPLFGQQQTQNFQPSTSAGVFGPTTNFGATSTQMGTVVKFNPVTGTDTMQKSGITHSISTKHHCITCMKEYESKSLEELRWEDYQCNRRGPQQNSNFGGTNFGPPASSAQTSFGQTENKATFGQANSFGAGNNFGITSQPNQATMFGKSTTTFGATPTSNAFGAFNTTTPAFSTNTAVKPFGSQPAPNVFGPTATTQASAFSGGSTFFGQPNVQNSSNLFSKPTQSAFNTQQQPVFAFGQQTTAHNNLFQPTKPATGFSSFGQTNMTSNSNFGQQSNMFSQTQQNPFNAFQKPAQSGFGQPVQSGFGIGTQPATNNSFFGANKPMFGNNTTQNTFLAGTGGFMMPQQQQSTQNMGLNMEMQPQNDFRVMVELMYEPFPYRDLFNGIEIKNYINSDVTNPTVLKKIMEDAPLPVTPSDDVSKHRVLITSKPIMGRTKLSLLENTVNPTSPKNNLILKNSTGKRLVLRNPTPRSDKDLLEEYKNMSSGGTRNRSLFKNVVPEEFNDQPTYMKNDGELSLINNEGEEEKTYADETGTPKTIQKRFPLFHMSNDEQLEVETPIVQSSKEIHNNRSSTLEEKNDSTPLSSIGNKGGKTVRFIDDDSNTMNDSDDKENEIKESNQIPSMETVVSYPYGVKLTRREYYTIPPTEDYHKYDEAGRCIIKDFTVGRYGYGNVRFLGQTDITNLDLDDIVHFGFRNVTIYPDDSYKPLIGEGLNKPAEVTLDHVYPRHRITQKTILDPKEIAADHFIDRLVLLSQKQNAELIDYRPESGSWIFKVDHFSKYEYKDSDDEELAKTINEDKLKQKLQEKDPELKEIDKMDANKIGLGGLTRYELAEEFSRQSSTFVQSGKLPALFSDDINNSILMKSSLFDDEESISDDISSSDLGIMHLSLPNSLTNTTGSSNASQKRRDEVPVIDILLSQYSFTPINKTLLNDSRNCMDTAVFKGKSFKVGWGPRFTCMTTTTPNVNTNPYVINEGFIDCQMDTVVHLKLINKPNKFHNIPLEKHLEIVFSESTVTRDFMNVPTFKIKSGHNSLVRHQMLTESTLNDVDTDTSYYNDLWTLCFALWGPIATSPTNRLELFSNWLETAAVLRVKNVLESDMTKKSTVLKNIFLYLTAHNVGKATDLAMENGFPNLSILISQISGNEESKLIIRDQLEQWNKDGYINSINRDLIKIYLLLGGIPFISDINVCDGLDWICAVAIHIWYLSPPGMSLIHGFQAYTAAFQLYGYVMKPNPRHHAFTTDTVHDTLYQIMTLFANVTMPLEQVINPATYTGDPLDYRLSWLLLQVFAELRVGTISQEVSDAVNMSFAAQLEDIGLWNWAIFVLLFTKDATVKKIMVMGVLDRHLDSDRKCKENLRTEDLLVHRFKVPPEWIHGTLLSKTFSTHKYIQTYKYLILNCDWCQAHEIVVKYLIPDFICSGESRKLYHLLKSLTPANDKILHWNTQAGLILEYLQMQHTIIHNQEELSEIELQALKTNLTNICDRMKDFPTHSSKQLMAIAELSRFIAILLKIVYCRLQPSSVENIQIASGLLQDLLMPPDYKYNQMCNHMYLSIKTT